MMIHEITIKGSGNLDEIIAQLGVTLTAITGLRNADIRMGNVGIAATFKSPTMSTIITKKRK